MGFTITNYFAKLLGFNFNKQSIQILNGFFFHFNVFYKHMKLQILRDTFYETYNEISLKVFS